MRVDVITIFPEYLTPLQLSLPGKAQAAGLLDLRVHDLRQWTHDRHRTVDDTPYGGGPGMVMRPEPWGEALDALLADAAEDPPVLVVLTPAGRPFTQEVAQHLAGAHHLVVACGRYEGIDQRVVDHATTRMRVEELSVGDYVLNGGEAAALVVLESVVRLLPGVVGNPESLHTESHAQAGLLEAPAYTKPATWRGLDVPAVLLSGDHAAVAVWREAESLRRTAHRRPDLVHPSRLVSLPGLPDAELRPAVRADLGELLTLQWACFPDRLRVEPEELGPHLLTGSTLVLRSGGRVVGAVRGELQDTSVWHISLLMVAPDLRRQGIGRFLLDEAERAAPVESTTCRLFTSADSADNLRLYRRAGYSLRGKRPNHPGVVVLTKPRR